MIEEPSSLPEWATDPLAEITTPGGGKQELGWVQGDIPPRGFVNWFWNLTASWIGHLFFYVRFLNRENWVIDGTETRLETSPTGPSSFSVEVDAGPSPAAVFINGKIVLSASAGVSTLAITIPPTGSGGALQQQWAIVAIKSNGSLAVKYGAIGVVGTDPTTSGDLPIARLKLRSDMPSIEAFDIVDLRVFRPFSSASIQPGGIQTESIEPQAVTRATIANDAVGPGQIEARSIDQFIMKRPLLYVGIDPAEGITLFDLSDRAIYRMRLKARYADGGALSTAPDIFPAGGGPGVWCLAELMSEGVASGGTLGGLGPLLERLPVDASGPALLDLKNSIVISHAGGAPRVATSGPSQVRGPFLFRMDSASGPSEGLDMTIPKGVSYPGGAYIMKITPVYNPDSGDLPIGGLPTYHRFSLPAIP